MGQSNADDEGSSMNQSDVLRVLVAEDEESFLRVLTTVLESTKRFTVYPCEGGEEAVEALKRSQFDIVILDYKMPGMSGLNVLQWIHEQKLDTPVILLTGAGSENIAVEAMKLGAYDYLRKDSFDRNHFPVIVNGVYERYLFKKDKDQREIRARKLEKDIAAFELLSNSLATFAQDVTATLSDVTQLTDESEQTLYPLLPAPGKEHFKSYLGKIREEYRILLAIGRSIVSLSRVVNDHYLKMQSLHQSEVELIEKMKTPPEGISRTN
jgi:DNA-binding response OmpR family regulator